MSRKSKYSIEQRVQACEDYHNGTRSLEEICIALGTTRKKTIREWLKKYEKYGVSAFQEKSYNKSYTKEFKIQVVEEYISGYGSLEELIVKYDISSTTQLRKWISVYNANRELSDYCPKPEVYMAEARRKTTLEERKEIVDYCISKNIPVMPGIVTPSELAQAVKRGLTRVKFFPATAAGGIKMIKAMCAAYTNVRIMPTGGINTANLEEFLSCDKIFCCGGSWMVKGDMIKAGEFDKIKDMTAEAVALVKKIRG